MSDKPETMREWEILARQAMSIERKVSAYDMEWNGIRDVLRAFREDIRRETKEAVKPAVALQLIEFDVSIEDRRKVDQVIDETGGGIKR